MTRSLFVTLLAAAISAAACAQPPTPTVPARSTPPAPEPEQPRPPAPAVPPVTSPVPLPAPQVADAPATAPPLTLGAGEKAPSGTVPPGTWTLREKEYWLRLNEELNDAVATTNKVCQSTMSAAYVAETFRGHFTEDSSYGLTGYVRSSCLSTVSSVQHVCARGEMQKNAVKSKLRRVECRYGEKGKTKVELRTGTLTVSIDPDAGGAVAGEATTRYLLDNL